MLVTVSLDSVYVYVNENRKFEKLTQCKKNQKVEEMDEVIVTYAKDKLRESYILFDEQNRHP